MISDSSHDPEMPLPPIRLPAVVPDDGPDAPRVRRSLERGWAKIRLIRELAQMEKTQTQLAKEYGVVQSAVSDFAARHRSEIDAVKADIEDQFAGLWIAKKLERLAEYQADVEILNDSRNGTIKKMLDVEITKIKAAIMRAVADELGQIPTRVNVSVTQRVTHVVEGVDLENLT